MNINLPKTINVVPNRKVNCMRRRSSGVLDKKNHNDPIAVNEVPQNVIE